MWNSDSNFFCIQNVSSILSPFFFLTHWLQNNNLNCFFLCVLLIGMLMMFSFVFKGFATFTWAADKSIGVMEAMHKCDVAIHSVWSATDWTFFHGNYIWVNQIFPLDFNRVPAQIRGRGTEDHWAPVWPDCVQGRAGHTQLQGRGTADSHTGVVQRWRTSGVGTRGSPIPSHHPAQRLALLPANRSWEAEQTRWGRLRLRGAQLPGWSCQPQRIAGGGK